MSALDDRPFPRGALVGAAALIGFSLIAVAGARLQMAYAPDPGPSVAMVHGPSVASRSLLFLDQPDGGIVVRDAQTGAQVDHLATGGDGFIRGVLRGMARERRAHEAGPEVPFLLSLRSDGSLWLSDAATGRSIELGGFGATNRDAFLNLLDQQGSPAA